MVLLAHSFVSDDCFLCSDCYPSDFLAPPGIGNGSKWIERVVGAFKGLRIPPQDLEVARHGMFYSVSPMAGLRVVVLNSVYCDFINPFAHLFGDDPAGMFAWLRKTLSLSRAAHERVYLVSHQSPGADHHYPNTVVIPHLTKSCDKQYNLIMDEFRDVIEMSFYGHEVSALSLWSSVAMEGVGESD